MMVAAGGSTMAPAAVRAMVGAQGGLRAGRTTINKASFLAKSALQGDFAAAYQTLPAVYAKVLQANPGSLMRVMLRPAEVEGSYTWAGNFMMLDCAAVSASLGCLSPGMCHMQVG